MNKIKSFFIGLAAMFPFAAGAIPPVALGLLAGAGAVAGFSVYRSLSPVNMSDAMEFFASCWTCQLFSDIIFSLSNLLPSVYDSIGIVMIPIGVALTFIWFAWRLVSGYIGSGKFEGGWSLASVFGIHLLKLSLFILLLTVPLPRILTTVVIEPIFNVGFTLNRVVAGDDTLSSCLVATAIAEPVTVSQQQESKGFFSSNLRHNITCELAQTHKITGLGMTVGWTLLNMAFNDEYMHSILWDIPILPNIPVFFAGLLILALFFYAMLPIPLYFLQVLIKLGLDLVMLPFMLLSWLFKGWSILPFNKSDHISEMVNRIIVNTLGIAFIGIFLSFAVFFLDAVFGNWQGASALEQSLRNNDSSILMDGLMVNNDSIVVVVLFGLFLAMFMTMIPKLIENLFSGAKIPKELYASAEKNFKTIRNNVKKWYDSVKKE